LRAIEDEDYSMSEKGNEMSKLLLTALLAGLTMVTPLGARSASAGDCASGEFTNTYDLIQAAIFDRTGCSTQICHGEAKEGGLDLRAGVSYDNLVDVFAESVPGLKIKRVTAGQAAASLLWLNLAGKTLPDQWEAPLRPMPLDPVPALAENELEAVRLWLEYGAPREGVVPGTGELLDACLPPPEPIQIKPLPPPTPGLGIQLKMPLWTLEAQSEHEICVATYYDVTDQVPVEARGPDGTTFRYKFHETRQDPLSHHMVPILYEGVASVDSPTWGPWTCNQGPKNGETCNPLDLGFCGEGGVCATQKATSIGCLGYGPGDGGIGFTAPGISITQETAGEFPLSEGVYEELPLKGIILWSSHAFNLTEKEGKLESWLNFEFSIGEEQVTRAENLFEAQDIFTMYAEPFTTDEVCHVTTFPENTHVFEWSSHMHKRGKRWRTFYGAYRCQPPGAPTPIACSPLGYDFVSEDKCAGTPCVASKRKHVGDCDLSNTVTVDEVFTSVNVALGSMPMSACAEADGNFDYAVTVDEVLTGVNAALQGVPAPEQLDPEETLFYVSTVYNDPIVIRPEVPEVFRGDDNDRSVTFCALYDNGYVDPSEVKRRSTSPEPPVSFPGAGGPCETATHCAEGKVEEPCSGRGEAARNRSCDTTTGAGDGFCDACPLRGGVTTEDEMFILLGRFYIP
jgi:hypothetical protein